MKTETAIQAVEVTAIIPEQLYIAQDEVAQEHLDRAIMFEKNTDIEQLKKAGDRAPVRARMILANTDGVKTKTALKELDNYRLGMTKPFRDYVTAINERFKPTVGMLNEASRKWGENYCQLKKLDDEFEAEERRRVQIENEKARKLAEQKNALAQKFADPNEPAPAPVAAVVKSVMPAPKIGKVQKRWVHEVYKTTAKCRKEHDAILLTYLKLSGKYDGLLDEAIRAKMSVAINDGTIEAMKIPGVSIEQKEFHRM